jgi:hypothetical protein
MIYEFAVRDPNFDGVAKSLDPEICPLHFQGLIASPTGGRAGFCETANIAAFLKPLVGLLRGRQALA